MWSVHVLIFAKIIIFEDGVPRVLGYISTLIHAPILVWYCLRNVNSIRSPVSISISCMFPIWLLVGSGTPRLRHKQVRTQSRLLQQSSFSSQPTWAGQSVKKKKVFPRYLSNFCVVVLCGYILRQNETWNWMSLPKWEHWYSAPRLLKLSSSSRR